MYFGLNIKKRKNFDVRDIAARLFLCPRISPEHVTRILEMITKRRIHSSSFERSTDVYINELRIHLETDKEEVWSIMKNKLNAWIKVFNPPTPKDYKYIESKFGFTQLELFGSPSITEKCYSLHADSPKEMASYVKQFIKGQDAAIDKLAVPFFYIWKASANSIHPK